MAVGTLATCREKVAQLVSDSLEEGWELEHQSRRRGIAVSDARLHASLRMRGISSLYVVRPETCRWLRLLRAGSHAYWGSKRHQLCYENDWCC